MGKFDSRHSQKMSQRKRQRKLKARIERKAVAVHEQRKGLKSASPKKKRAAPAASA